MKKSQKILETSYGFTLLELIVVFSVIAILSTIGIASFVAYSRSQSVQTAASNFALTLESAKSRASSQVKLDACSGALNGYQVDISTSNPTKNAYSLNVLCPDVHLIQPITLPDNGNIKFDLGQTTTTSILFPVLTGAVGGSGTIVLTGYGQSRWVCVDAKGIVKVLSSPCP